MPQKKFFDLWKETVSAKSISKDPFKYMHLAVMQQATKQKPSEQHFLIQFEIHDFVLYESKGQLKSLTSLVLPEQNKDAIWFCFQFQGRSTFSSGTATEPDTLFSFTLAGIHESLTLAAERHWVLFIGVSGASKQQLLAEFNILRTQYDQQHILKAASISHVERQILQNLSKIKFGPFSTIYHIGQLVLKLYKNYALQIDLLSRQIKEEPQIRLYHQAIAYIRANFMDQALSREKIAEALHCSIRSLNRAFEGRPSSVNATILSLRLYKGRELLHNQPDLSVEQIAITLYFPDAKHFAVQYKKYFHKTPREDRKKIAPRKE